MSNLNQPDNNQQDNVPQVQQDNNLINFLTIQNLENLEKKYIYNYIHIVNKYAKYNNLINDIVNKYKFDENDSKYNDLKNNLYDLQELSLHNKKKDNKDYNIFIKKLNKDIETIANNIIDNLDD